MVKRRIRFFLFIPPSSSLKSLGGGGILPSFRICKYKTYQFKIFLVNVKIIISFKLYTDEIFLSVIFSGLEDIEHETSFSSKEGNYDARNRLLYSHFYLIFCTVENLVMLSLLNRKYFEKYLVLPVITLKLTKQSN